MNTQARPLYDTSDSPAKTDGVPLSSSAIARNGTPVQPEDSYLQNNLALARSTWSIDPHRIVEARSPGLATLLNLGQRLIRKATWWYSLPQLNQSSEFHGAIVRIVDVLLARQRRLQERLTTLESHVFARSIEQIPPVQEQAFSQQDERFNFRETYTNLLNRLKQMNYTHEEAAKLTIGGNFEAYGILERELLIQSGLQKEDYLIDVGCGSGRLGKPLSEYLTGKYLGIDVVPDLLEHARQYVGRSDWRFELAQGLAIPEQDEQADMVCFFSVFTHLLHEQSYVYLREAKRVLKPGGKIVFSFVEFARPHHWANFEAAIEEIGMNLPLYVFMSRDGIESWASHLGLTIEAIYDGDKPFIHLPCPIVFDDGRVVEGEYAFGQSVCVLSKPIAE